jgi:hypothetical protein
MMPFVSSIVIRAVTGVQRSIAKFSQKTKIFRHRVMVKVCSGKEINRDGLKIIRMKKKQ